MLFAPRAAKFAWTYDNWGANPSSTPGTSVVPGTSNAEGSWTQIASAANIANDVYGFYIMIHGGFSVGVSKQHLLDIGVDPAGGTSYSAVISNFVCGQSPTLITTPGNREHFFPLFIPAGSAVAVRVQGSHSTAGTVRVSAQFYGKPSLPYAFPVGRYSETIGTITNSSGVSFTPGNAADGSWTLLGATTKDLWWWQIGYQVDNATMSGESTYIEIAHGDGTNKHSILRIMHQGSASEVCGAYMQTQLNPFAAYAPVLAGTNIYVRGRCSDAPDTGYNAVAVGIGG